LVSPQRKHKAALSELINQLNSTRSTLADTQAALEQQKKRVREEEEQERKERDGRVKGWEEERVQVGGSRVGRLARDLAR
jgi:hypothetical protein